MWSGIGFFCWMLGWFSAFYFHDMTWFYVGAIALLGFQPNDTWREVAKGFRMIRDGRKQAKQR